MGGGGAVSEVVCLCLCLCPCPIHTLTFLLLQLLQPLLDFVRRIRAALFAKAGAMSGKSRDVLNVGLVPCVCVCCTKRCDARRLRSRSPTPETGSEIKPF